MRNPNHELFKLCRNLFIFLRRWRESERSRVLAGFPRFGAWDCACYAERRSVGSKRTGRPGIRVVGRIIQSSGKISDIDSWSFTKGIDNPRELVGSGHICRGVVVSWPQRSRLESRSRNRSVRRNIRSRGFNEIGNWNKKRSVLDSIGFGIVDEMFPVRAFFESSRPEAARFGWFLPGFGLRIHHTKNS